MTQDQDKKDMTGEELGDKLVYGSFQNQKWYKRGLCHSNMDQPALSNSTKKKKHRHFFTKIKI